MNRKLIMCAAFIAVFFLGIATAWTVLVSSSVIVKPEEGVKMSLTPLKAEPSKLVSDESSDGLVNINTADMTELMGLPGIGEQLAERLIEYREKNGDFQSKEEIMAVSGIGEAKYDGIMDYIKIK